MDLIQLADPGSAGRVTRVGTEGRIVERGDAAGRIGDRERDAEVPYLIGKCEQRAGGGALPGIVQAGEDVTQQAARLARVITEVTCHDPGRPDRAHAEQ